MHRTWIEISSRALQQNIQTLKNLTNKEARFCAVIKANAYGHGLKEVAQIAAREGVDAFAVDNIDEAIQVRSAHGSALIIVLGYTLFTRYQDAIIHNIDLTVGDLEGIAHAEQIAATSATTIRIHVKLETGTSRQGIQSEYIDDAIRALQRAKHIRLAGLSTHFANIEDSANPQYATQQFQTFTATVARFKEQEVHPEYTHCTCSAALILYPQTHGTLVRTGISLYGHWSSELVQETARDQKMGCELNPILTWKTRIAQIKEYPIGTPISYGLTEVLKRRGRVAVLPVGYSDGYSRTLSSKGEVLIHGVRCKVLGRICMNMTMVDVSDVPKAKKEDEVILIGMQGRYKLSAEELASKAGTISYEILARINPTLPRIIV